MQKTKKSVSCERKRSEEIEITNKTMEEGKVRLKEVRE